MARETWSNSTVDCMIGGVSNEGLIMAYWFNVLKDYTSLDILQKNPANFAPFLETGFDVNDPRSVEFGKLLKQTYYGCTQPSKSNIEGYFYFAGDYFFWHGIQRAALLRASKAKGKTFVYRYDVLTKQNFFKINFSKSEAYPGTEHAADVCYLFKGTYIDPPAIDSIEFENVKKTVDIFTSFAINGDPNCSWCEGWKPIETTELPIKAMNIGTEKCDFIELPETERLAVWNGIFEKAGVDLY